MTQAAAIRGLNLILHLRIDNPPLSCCWMRHGLINYSGL